MPLLIRRALSTQAAELSALAFSAKAFWGYSEQFMAQCKSELSYHGGQLSADDWFFAAAYQNAHRPAAICGFYALSLANPLQIELEALFVKPAVIGQGIGKALFRHAAEHARVQGGKKLLIQADPNAAPFYQAMGAQKIGHQVSHSIPGRMLPLFSYPLI